MKARIEVSPGATPCETRRARREMADECLALALEAFDGGGRLADVPVLVCGAKNRKGGDCPNECDAGDTRCKWHGGKSTGPKTAAGKRRAAESRWGKGGADGEDK